MSVTPTEFDFALLGDHPEIAKDDALGFDQVASQLAEMLLASEAVGPFTLGIEAGWGMGKSSLMRHIERELVARAQTKKVVPVWFNAWTAEGDDVLEGLVKSVLAEMNSSALRRTLRNKQLVSWLRVVVMVLAQWLRLSDVVDVFWEKTGTDVRTRNELQTLVQDAIDEWAKRSPAPEGRMLVVFIDDLDRCSPDNVFRVFEAVKLYLATPQFVFVIGFDQAVISQAILREKKYADAETGRSYLEKVVQMGFPIPRPSDEQIAVLTDQYLKASGTRNIIDAPAESLIVELNERNPRRIKRFLNWFVLEHRLDRGADGLNAKLLVTALIIHLYFFDFRRLFELPGDPIQEFQSYRHLVELRGRAIGDDAVARDAFTARGLDVPEVVDDDVLAELEKKLPTEFKALLGDTRFVSLVGDLERDERAKVGHWLSRKGPVADFGETVQADVDLAGLKVLWIDDRPHSVRAARALVERHDGRITPALSGDEAEPRLPGRVDVLVSDINRHGEKNRGFKDVQRWRSTGRYSGPVVFYTTNVTPERIETARSLGAELCKSPQALLTTLAAISLAPSVVAPPLEAVQPLRPVPRPRPVLAVPRPPELPVFGRDDELRAAVDALREGRNVQLAGAAGDGKTSLLRLLVNEPEVQPPEGVVYVRGDDLTLADVMRSVFDDLYVTGVGSVPSLDEIRSLLHDERLLVALDEPSLQEGEIRMLMDAMPQSRFVLARRTPYVLGDDTLTIELDPLDPAAAIALFESQLDRTLTPAERPVAEELIEKANGHPLSIMLAAAAIRTGRERM